jgi:RNA polymerase sigma factor (TIGR02999 family)
MRWMSLHEVVPNIIMRQMAPPDTKRGNGVGAVKVFSKVARDAMSPTESQPVTYLLRRFADGDSEAARELFDVLYTELKAMAGSVVKRQGSQQTLQPTELVHELFAKLVRGSTLPRLKDRVAFYAVAAQTMQSIMVDQARRRTCSKRPQQHSRVPLDDMVDWFEQSERIDVIALSDAMEQLSQIHSRQHQVVTLHFFAGLYFHEIADQLGVSLSTVEKDWRFARCWLLEQLAT